MIERLVEHSLRNRLAAFVTAVIIALAGWYAYRNLTVEAFPDPSDLQVEIISLFPGQPAEEVERRVSIPIERAVNGAPGLMRVRSISLFGLSYVTLTFADGIDVLVARQQVGERLGDAELPDGVKPDLGPLATPIGEVYRYTLEGKTADPRTLRTLQDWTVRPALMRVPGVADVVTQGGLVKEIHVTPQPTKMAALGVAITDIFQALAKGSDNATGGYLERGQEMFVIRSLGTFRDLSDIAEVRVSYHDGVPVHVKDVCQISEAYAPRQGVVTRNGDQDAVEGIVLMRRGENPSVVLKALRERVKQLNDRVLGKVKIVPFYDRTELVNTTLDTVFHNLGEGAFLVTAVVFVFLLSLRASLIVAAVIPLSLAASFIYLKLRGMSANLLSMGAIDFGIIVDGAVILVEHMFEHAAGAELGADKDDETLLMRVFALAKEVARPTLFSLLIIIAAYLPIFTLQRVEGRIFSPMANTVVSALVGAMLMSFTLVPVLCLFALRRHKKPQESPLLKAARRTYFPALDFCMKQPVMVFVLALGALGAAVTLVPRIGSEFLPELNEGGLYIHFGLPPNMSMTEARKIIPRIDQILRRTPEVTELLSQLGRPEDGTDPKLLNNLETFIKLRPMSDWRPEMKTLNDIVAEMDRNLKELPGIDYNFSQPIRDNVNENISGQFGQIAVKIRGEDLKALQETAEKAKSIIGGVPGVADLGIVRSSDMPQIAIHMDRDALARYDLDLADVNDYVETALGGHVASQLWEGEKRFDVTVRMPPSTREDVSAIQALLLPLKNGSLIPLSAIATVAMDTGRAGITREDGQRYVGIRMNVRNRDLGSFVAEAQAKVAAELELPPGYEMTWGGEFENQERAMARLKLVIPLALLITFLLLFSAFNSIWDATLVIANVPFALIGGIAALAVADMTLSVSAAVGFIALLGQAVLNGVLVVSAIKARRAAGEDAWTATIGGARDRLRAILMTALLASLGLLPAAMSHAIGSETQRPIAVVVVGGTITAALLTLIVLPVTYYWAGVARERILRLFGKRIPGVS